MASKVTFYQKSTCTTCRKAKGLLQELKVDFMPRDLDKERLSESELDQLIGERDYKRFLNTRNELYRTRKMKEHPPSRAEASTILHRNANAWEDFARLDQRSSVVRSSGGNLNAIAHRGALDVDPSSRWSSA